TISTSSRPSPRLRRASKPGSIKARAASRPAAARICDRSIETSALTAIALIRDPSAASCVLAGGRSGTAAGASFGFMWLYTSWNGFIVNFDDAVKLEILVRIGRHAYAARVMVEPARRPVSTRGRYL